MRSEGKSLSPVFILAAMTGFLLILCVCEREEPFNIYFPRFLLNRCQRIRKENGRWYISSFVFQSRAAKTQWEKEKSGEFLNDRHRIRFQIRPSIFISCICQWWWYILSLSAFLRPSIHTKVGHAHTTHLLHFFFLLNCSNYRSISTHKKKWHLLDIDRKIVTAIQPRHNVINNALYMNLCEFL